MGDSSPSFTIVAARPTRTFTCEPFPAIVSTWNRRAFLRHQARMADRNGPRLMATLAQKCARLNRQTWGEQAKAPLHRTKPGREGPAVLPRELRPRHCSRGEQPT